MNTKENKEASIISFDKSCVEMREKKTVYQGFFDMTTYRFRHRLFSGGWSDEISRELFERGHAAAVLPYDPITDSVVLVEQFRIGAHIANCQPWQLEIVAGIIDTDESPEEVAQREAIEEAGIDVSDFQSISRYLSSAGGTSEVLSVFVGRVDSSKAKGIHGVPEEGEDIRVHVVSRQEAYAWVESGKIENAATIIALQWLQLNVARLQQQWGEL